MNEFQASAISRGNIWECQVCGGRCHAAQMIWEDATPQCPHCHTQDMLVEQRGEKQEEPPAVIVTRHPALRELLMERGIVKEDTPCIEHATPEQVQGRHVYGVLPLNLAAKAALVTEVPLTLSPEQRGKELDLEELKKVAGEATTYKVQIIS